ncbi:MAG: HTH domain-containing protein, partial [Actinomyces oris]
MRADRLLSMIWLLRAHGRLSASELAQRLEVSRRTVLPPAAKDPFGLASAVNPGMTGKGKEAKSPQSISETITHCQEVQSSKNSLGQGYEEAGVISIQRVEHADGRVSWVVYVPGTTDWTSGDGEPQDLLTNLEAVGGTPTAMESGVVTAMRQAGIQPGEEVALYGHSQGGITVSNIAADPAIQERYNITTVLTAGSPTAGADIPDDVHALHL